MHADIDITKWSQSIAMHEVESSSSLAGKTVTGEDGVIIRHNDNLHQS